MQRNRFRNLSSEEFYVLAEHNNAAAQRLAKSLKNNGILQKERDKPEENIDDRPQGEGRRKPARWGVEKRGFSENA
ncbi:hypothetical protein R2294_001411 [Cronobacter dublinensis]|nr:hypothetical protein [Cronobacter dublinensis]